MTGFSIKSLKEGIKKSDANIVIFEDAKKKELQTQEEYRQMIEESNKTGFNIESLKEGIKSCDKNILVFEEAVRKERETQEDYRNMIEGATLNEEKRNVVKSGVEVEAEREAE
jgi:hypothetical protein